MHKFGFLILRVTFFLVLFVLATNVLFQRPWLESIMFSLALAVGLAPELLPMVVTVTLARGALHLARRGVIAKRLAAIHDLGAMNTLCTDKTGTLTEAKIRLVRHVDGEGLDCPKVLRLAYLNSAFDRKSTVRSTTQSSRTRNQTSANRTKLDEVPFDFERRRISVLLETRATAERLLIVKGDAGAEIHDIARHQLFEMQLALASVAEHQRLWCDGAAQRIDGVVRVKLLDEIQRHAQRDDDDDDEEACPIAGQRRQRARKQQDENERVKETEEELNCERVTLAPQRIVGTIPLKPRQRFGLGQPLARGLQVAEQQVERGARKRDRFAHWHPRSNASPPGSRPKSNSATTGA